MVRAGLVNFGDEVVSEDLDGGRFVFLFLPMLLFFRCCVFPFVFPQTVYC